MTGRRLAAATAVATPVKAIIVALLLALNAGPALGPDTSLGVGSALAADNRVNSLLDAITAVPGKESKTSATSVGKAGPTAPTQPVAPVVKPLGGVDQTTQRPLAAPAQPRQERTGKTGRAKPAAAHPSSPDAKLILQYDGARREALVHLPPVARSKVAGPGSGKRFPILVFLHGAGGSAAQAIRQTNLIALSDRAGFIAVFPEGLGEASGGQTWNAWNCCGYARDTKIDDVGYLAALLQRLKTDLPTDPRRIYLAGFSNGAMLASRFALERPGIVAAIASVSGSIPCDIAAENAGAEPLPVLLIHGDQDRMARFGPTEAHPATGRYCEDYPARAQAEFWVRRMNLSTKGQLQDGPKTPARTEIYGPTGKAASRPPQNTTAEVRFVIIKGGGHAWPGGAREVYRYCDMPTRQPDASVLVWEFLSRHSRPGPAAEKKAAPKRGAKG